MKLMTCALALVMVAPAAGRSQSPCAPVVIDTKAALANMESNFSRIAGPLEKSRWQANITLWQMRVNRAGKPSKADLDKMQVTFDSMKTNVAHITEQGERERWQVNRDLWELLLAQPEKISSADHEKMQLLYDKMHANVVKISSVWERARWTANQDLWQSVINPQ